MANAPKTTSPAKQEKSGNSGNLFASLAILICLGIGILVYTLVMGNPEIFIDNNPANQPKPGNYLGKVYYAGVVVPVLLGLFLLVWVFSIVRFSVIFKACVCVSLSNFICMVYHAGVVVPVLIGLFLMVWVFSIERFIVIGKASGTGNVGNFVRKVQSFLKSGSIDAAIAECDKQKGSVANVIKAGLLKYKDVEANPALDAEKSALAIQKEIEETTALEMPMLEKNLNVIATLVSIGTLTGLLGTVTGMIRAFAALATG